MHKQNKMLFNKNVDLKKKIKLINGIKMALESF